MPVRSGQVLEVLVVCHAGMGVGLGHLTRSIVIARALQQDLSARVQILIQGDVVPLDDANSFDHHFLKSEESLKDVVSALAGRDDVKLLVFDLHPERVPPDIDDLFVELRKSGRRLVAVDSMSEHSKFLDLVFIPAFQFQPPPPPADPAKFIFGWDCFLLNVRQTPRPWRAGNNVLVLSGGSDTMGLGRTWPQEINDCLPSDSDLHWVTGPFAETPIWPESPRIEMHNHISPRGLDSLMVNACYAITLYGVSFYELLYYGIPTVVFSPYGGKDDSELMAIAALGVASVAHDEHDAIDKLKELMLDDELAGALSTESLRRMSVRGGHRFVSSVATLLS